MAVVPALAREEIRHGHIQADSHAASELDGCGDLGFHYDTTDAVRGHPSAISSGRIPMLHPSSVIMIPPLTNILIRVSQARWIWFDLQSSAWCVVVVLFGLVRVRAFGYPFDAMVVSWSRLSGCDGVR